MFQDRADAGVQLAEKLYKYRGENPIVLAIPRGGVEVGAEIARALRCPLTIVVVRKLPFPGNPEAGFGAIAEDGSTFMIRRYENILPDKTVRQVIQEQQQEIHRRVTILRRGKPLPDLTGRTVILTDDGIAMGSTMHAAVQLCKNHRAGKIIVAAPVSAPETADRFAQITDETIVLDQPRNFYAVAQAYADWYDVPDEEVLQILDQFSAYAKENKF